MSDWGARHLSGEGRGDSDHPLADDRSDDQGRWQRDDGMCQVPGDRLAQLVEIIESETIPRLVLAHQENTAARDFREETPRKIDRSCIQDLTALVLSPDQQAALTYVRSLREQGIRRETLFLDLLGPTARHLGRLWEEDLCDFTEVTVGLCRLHQLVREMSAGLLQKRNGVEPRRALLAPVPGEQHTFGLLMVTEFFRREGWDVWGGPSARDHDVLQVVNAERFDVVGFSLSCDEKLDELSEWIRSIRNASRNPEIGVLVGGRVFIENPELVGDVGADGTAADARQAASRAGEIPPFLKRH